MKKILKFAIVAIISSFGSLQAAEFEGNIALSSEYMWRGMTQSDGEAAVSAAVSIYLVKVEHISEFGDQMSNMAMTQQWN